MLTAQKMLILLNENMSKLRPLQFRVNAFSSVLGFLSKELETRSKFCPVRAKNPAQTWRL